MNKESLSAKQPSWLILSAEQCLRATEIGAFSSTAETATGENVDVPVANDENTTTWADSVDREGIQSPGPLPDALEHLYNKGLRFKKVPEFFWNYDGEQPKLSKCCSVYFSVDSVCSSQLILEAFDKAGIDIDEIRSIQRKNSSRSWVVTFDCASTKEDALEVSCIEINGQSVFLGDCENRLELVKIYEAPSELPDTTLIGRLSFYGKVLSFRRDRIADSIDNGVRTARMRLRRPIPSTINLAGEFLRIWYPSQPKTCRNCGAEDHIAKDCDSVRCFNCERPGHRSRDCEEITYCPVCKGDDHVLAVCPFVVYSANVDVPAEKKDEESLRKAKEDRKKRREAENTARAMVNRATPRGKNNISANPTPSRLNNNRIDPIDQAIQPMDASVERMKASGERVKVAGRAVREGKNTREAGSRIVIERRKEGSAVKEKSLRSGRNGRDGMRKDLIATIDEIMTGIMTATDRQEGITDQTKMTTAAGILFHVVNVNVNFNYDC